MHISIVLTVAFFSTWALKFSVLRILVFFSTLTIGSMRILFIAKINNAMTARPNCSFSINFLKQLKLSWSNKQTRVRETIEFHLIKREMEDLKTSYYPGQDSNGHAETGHRVFFITFACGSFSWFIFLFGNNLSVRKFMSRALQTSFF